MIFLREAGLHLFKTLIMHFGGVDVASHDLRTKRPRQFHTQIDSHIGMVGIVDRNVDSLIHVSFPPQASAWEKPDVSLREFPWAIVSPLALCQQGILLEMARDLNTGF